MIEYLNYMQELLSNDLLLAAAIILAGLAASKIVHLFCSKFLKKLTEKTKTDVDDIVLKMLEQPLEGGVMLAAFFAALLSINYLSPHHRLISDVFFVILAFWAAQALQEVVSFLVLRWIRVSHKQYENSPKILTRIIAGTIYLVAVLVILDHFSIEITPMVAALGIGGLAVGLALQDSLSNFFAGIYMVSGNPVRVGDFVEIPSEKISGYVEDISWRATKIRTLPNTTVIIPNSRISQAVLVNTYLPDKEVATLVQCGVAYSSDLDKVEKATVEVAAEIQKTVPGAVKSFVPFIRYNTFADSNINFTVILRSEEFVAGYLLTHEFIKALKRRYDKEGIEISFPARVLYHKDAMPQRKSGK